jgi:hypothetical protein
VQSLIAGASSDKTLRQAELSRERHAVSNTMIGLDAPKITERNNGATRMPTEPRSPSVVATSTARSQISSALLHLPPDMLSASCVVAADEEKFSYVVEELIKTPPLQRNTRAGLSSRPTS